MDKMEHSEQPQSIGDRANAITQLRSLVSDNTGTKLPSNGEFFYYFGLGQFNRVMPLHDPDWKGFGAKGDEFCKRMFILANDFDSIVTIIHKVEWLTAQWQQRLLEEQHWSAYVKTDIHAFHAELRSVYDSIAKAISISSNKSNQLPDSFHDLREFCQINGGRAESLIGKELTALIASAEWFSESRHIRDQIIHFERDVRLGVVQRADSLVVMFRTVIGEAPNDVYQGPVEFRLEGDGWIMFRPYSGYYFGRLWHLLNEVCRLAGQRLTVPKSGFSWVHPRLQSALDSVSCAVELLELAKGSEEWMKNCDKSNT